MKRGMKTLGLFALFAVAFLFVSPSAQAQPSCHGTGFCDWMINGGFDPSTGWTKDSAATYTVISDPCLSGAPPNKVAELVNGTWLHSPTMYIDGSYGTHTKFEVEFNLYLLNDTDNWYDQLKVIVKNHDTNVTETFYIRGDTYNTTCTRRLLKLSRNYLNHNVSVRFEVGWLTLGKYQIDGVSFWSY